VNALRPSEREVFDLLITCYSNAELAVRLGKSRQTIINQIGGLKQHFDVNSREELILISILCLPEA
jgi:DNA-binding CsgD family transcriptional regulator